MEPKIVKRPAMTLVGLVVSGKSVGDIDIGGLWDRFIKGCQRIKHAVKGKSYEIHIEQDAEPRIHFCLVGLEVKQAKDLPDDMFAKTVPAGEYALFTYSFKDGGFGAAFKNVYQWLDRSNYTNARHFDIQCYDKRFRGPRDSRSVIEILVPVKRKSAPLT